MDSGYSYPYILLAWTHWMDMYFRTSKSPKQSMSNAFELAQKALSIDFSMAPAHVLLGYIYLFKRQYEKGIAETKKAVEVNPNYADGYSHIARLLHYVGRNEEAVELINKAMRLNPFPPSFYYYQLGYCYFTMEQYEQAIEEFKKAIDLEPKNQPALVGLAASYSSLGRDEEALSAGKNLCKIAPNFSVKSWVKKLPYKNEADCEHITKSLYKARLPE
jgi:adenylate cyclase